MAKFLTMVLIDKNKKEEQKWKKTLHF
jgi:hypothetical protein